MIKAAFRAQIGDFLLNSEFEVPSVGVTALFGRSGSGKTTVLRCAAGLVHTQQGFFSVNDEVWEDSAKNVFMAPDKRAVGYVFQEPSLFSHLSVHGNLMYAYKRSHQSLSVFDKTIEFFGLARFLERSPSHLSGGEQQRVAIARSLLSNPRLLLLDEPLSALDSESKAEIFPYLERLKTETKIPMIYVSHSLDEVKKLADYVLLIEKGAVVQARPSSEFFSR